MTRVILIFISLLLIGCEYDGAVSDSPVIHSVKVCYPTVEVKVQDDDLDMLYLLYKICLIDAGVYCQEPIYIDIPRQTAPQLHIKFNITDNNIPGEYIIWIKIEDNAGNISDTVGEQFIIY